MTTFPPPAASAPSASSPVRCTRCIYDSSVAGISFDAQGVCSACALHDEMAREYPLGDLGTQKLHAIADEIRAAGRGRPYDLVIGVSGGCDSSYMLHLAKKELNLRPLAVHFDNTWNSTVAVENIETMLRALDIDLYTYVVDNEEYDDIYRAFLEAGLPDIEAPTDIGLAAVMSMAATKFGVRYVFDGHSFRTEGVSPLGWLYMDGRYIYEVHRRFGKRPMKTYPNLWFSRFVWYSLVGGLKKIRPLYWLDYQKEEVKRMLQREYGWKWYGGHHLENRFTAFFHSYFLPQRFQADGRMLGYAALVRSGQLDRDEALRLLATPQTCDPEILEIVKKRLGFSEQEFSRLMALKKHSYREYKTYKKWFERTRWFWWMMYKLERVPKSFYVKYTRPSPR